MLKKALLLTAVMTLISYCTAFAQIEVEPDNLTNTLNYRIYKNHHGTNIVITETCFIKSLQEDNHPKYFIRFRTAKHVLFSNKLKLNIGKKAFEINKVVNQPVPKFYSSIPAVDVFLFAYYSIPDNAIEEIKHAQEINTEVTFQVYKKIETIAIANVLLAEAKNLIENARFDNYRDEFDKLTDKYLPPELAE